MYINIIQQAFEDGKRIKHNIENSLWMGFPSKRCGWISIVDLTVDITIHIYLYMCTAFLLPLRVSLLLVLSLYKEDYLQFIDLRPSDYTAFVVSGKVGNPFFCFTTPIGWFLLLQLTVLSRSAFVVLSKFLVGCVVNCFFFNFLIV